jgi:hypothetical protein
MHYHYSRGHWFTADEHGEQIKSESMNKPISLI